MNSQWLKMLTECLFSGSVTESVCSFSSMRVKTCPRGKSASYCGWHTVWRNTHTVNIVTNTTTGNKVYFTLMITFNSWQPPVIVLSVQFKFIYRACLKHTNQSAVPHQGKNHPKSKVMIKIYKKHGQNGGTCLSWLECEGINMYWESINGTDLTDMDRLYGSLMLGGFNLSRALKAISRILTFILKWIRVEWNDTRMEVMWSFPQESLWGPFAVERKATTEIRSGGHEIMDIFIQSVTEWEERGRLYNIKESGFCLSALRPESNIVPKIWWEQRLKALSVWQREWGRGPSLGGPHMAGLLRRSIYLCWLRRIYLWDRSWTNSMLCQ